MCVVPWCLWWAAGLGFLWVSCCLWLPELQPSISWPHSAFWYRDDRNASFHTQLYSSNLMKQMTLFISYSFQKNASIGIFMHSPLSRWMKSWYTLHPTNHHMGPQPSNLYLNLSFLSLSLFPHLSPCAHVHPVEWQNRGSWGPEFPFWRSFALSSCSNPGSCGSRQTSASLASGRCS